MAEVVDIGAWQWQMVGNEVRGRRENWELKEKEEEILDGVQEKYKPLVLLTDRVWHFVFEGLFFGGLGKRDLVSVSKNLLSAKKSFQRFVVQVHSYICDFLESRDNNWITLKCLTKMSITRCTTYRTSIAEWTSVTPLKKYIFRFIVWFLLGQLQCRGRYFFLFHTWKVMDFSVLNAISKLNLGRDNFFSGLSPTGNPLSRPHRCMQDTKCYF